MFDFAARLQHASSPGERLKLWPTDTAIGDFDAAFASADVAVDAQYANRVSGGSAHGAARVHRQLGSGPTDGVRGRAVTSRKWVSMSTLARYGYAACSACSTPDGSSTPRRPARS
jgi:hypothetical protein